MIRKCNFWDHTPPPPPPLYLADKSLLEKLRCLSAGGAKNGFQIVSPCCTYVSTVTRSALRSAFADILVPLVPLDFM